MALKEPPNLHFSNVFFFQKIEILPYFFCNAKWIKKKCLLKFYREKKACSDDVKTSYNKTRNLHLSKGVSP